ncbi:MAG: PKD domain-containing protein, partial [Vicinamibacteria bacterium]
VGASRWEELDIGVAGGNFGWQLSEGPEPPGITDVIYPIYAYPHTSPAGHAIIAGGHAPAGGFPPEYEGDYFFADYVTREIYRMVLDESNAPVSIETFAEQLDFGSVDLKFGPDGALYYLTIDGGELRRIVFAGGANRYPVAKAVVFPDSGRAPLSVSFDASASFDPEGQSLEIEWDLGDGERASGMRVVKQYGAGVYSASLTVTDPGGARAELRDVRIVSGNERPEAVIQTPRAGRTYFEGDAIEFSGIGIDPELGQLPCSDLSWYVVFHHAGHTHPYLGPVEGICAGSFVVDSHGELEETFFEIRLTAKDDGGALGNAGVLRGTASVTLRPAAGR